MTKIYLEARNYRLRFYKECVGGYATIADYGIGIVRCGRCTFRNYWEGFKLSPKIEVKVLIDISGHTTVRAMPLSSPRYWSYI